MKIEVYDGPTEVEQVLRLKLVKEGVTVTVVAVDADGHTYQAGSLLEIRPDGTLYRCKYVGSDLGIQLDSRKRMILTGE